MNANLAEEIVFIIDEIVFAPSGYETSVVSG